MKMFICEYRKKLLSTFLALAIVLTCGLFLNEKVLGEVIPNNSIMMVIDTSGSMGNDNKLDNSKIAAAAFIDSHQGDEIGLITFNSNGDKIVVSNMTTDYNSLKNSINQLTTEGDSNKLERPLKESIEMAKNQVKSNHKSNNGMVIVMTDVTEDLNGDPESISDVVKQSQYDVEFTETPQSIMLVIDASGSMGTTKMENAKQAALNFIELMKGKDVELGLVVFYDSGNIRLESPLTSNLDVVKTKIPPITATGLTPLAASIKLAGEELVQHSSYSKGRIIVFSDGQETCGGNPIAEATAIGTIDSNANGAYLNITIDTIGIEVDEWTKKQLQDIANAANGGYYDVTDSSDFDDVINDIGNNSGINKIEIVTPSASVSAGQTVQLAVQATSSDGLTSDITKEPDIVYSSSNNLIASVTQDGIVKVSKFYKSGGTVEITATYEGLSDICILTIPSIDETAPKIVATDPENKAVSVLQNKTISITFDESIIEADNFKCIKLLKNGKDDTSIIKRIEGNTIVIEPNGELKYKTKYTLVIPKKSVSDNSGNKLATAKNIAFTVCNPPDTKAPHVLSSVPNNGYLKAELDKSISVKFSENIQASTSYDTITLKDELGNDIPFVKNINSNQLVLSQTQTLNYNTKYVVNIPTDSICDMSNNGLTTPYQFVFTTKRPPDNNPPILTNSSIANNQVNVAVDSVIKLTFDEEIKAGKYSKNIWLLKDGKDRFSIKATINDNKIIITPSKNLPKNKKFDLVIPKGAIQDMSENLTSETYKISFKTQR